MQRPLINESALGPLRELDSSSLKTGYIASGRWVFIGSMAAKPLQILTFVALARVLGPANFGLFGLSNSAAVSLAGLVSFGLDGAANKFVAEYYRRWPEKGIAFTSLIVWGSIFLSMLVFTVLGFSRESWILRFFPAHTSLQLVNDCLMLGWIFVMVTLWNNVLTGLQLFREIAILGIIQITLMGVLGLGFGIWKGTNGAMEGYVLSSICTALIGAAMIWRIDRRLFRFPWIIQWADLKAILNFSFPAWLGYFTIGPVTTLTLSFLGRQPGGAMQMGYMDTASAVKFIIGILPAVVTTVLGPVLIEESGVCGRADAFEKLFANALMAISFLTIPVLILTLFWSDLLGLIYGRLYIKSIAVFLPLAGSYALTLSFAPVVLGMVGRNKIWTLQAFALFYALLLYGFARLWIPGFLSIGLAWAFFAAQSIYNITLYEYGVTQGILPGTARGKYYGFQVIVTAILVLAWFLPRTGRWALALPLSMGWAVVSCWQNPMALDWAISAVPGRFQPALRRASQAFLDKLFRTPFEPIR